MRCLARDGGHLANLVHEAAALCRAAQNTLPARSRPGRPETFEQWQIAVLIFVAVARRCKSKSAQWRYLDQHRKTLLAVLGPVLGLKRLPSRATYMRRYPKAWPLFQEAIELGGRRALREHVADANTVAVDKSLIAARGPVWAPALQRRQEKRPGVDVEAGWGYSPHDGWTYGYSYEVVVSAGKTSRLVLPLLASADAANRNEHRSFAEKIPRLPRSVRNVLGDGGYDGNDPAEAIEHASPRGRSRRPRRTGRRFLCPMQRRGGKPAVGRTKQKGRREQRRRHRLARDRFYHSRRGQRLYARRFQTVEPFNQWFKHLFDLEQRTWHRGLDNNRTMLLAALLCYQTCQRCTAHLGHRDGQIQWILDGL
jgi:hypothetical protein